MILEVQNISQSFAEGFWMRQKQVLFDVILQVSAGSVFGFLGANGAGKTTLIHLIAGLKRPKGGSIRISGLDMRSHSAQAKQKLGYLPERPYFYEHLTGEDFLTYLGALSRMSAPMIRARIPQVLAIVGMSAEGRVKLKNYSKGMLQRIGIAQAILHEPELLLFDEPMSGLDPVGRREIRELMVDLAKRGHTVFFSTHVIPDAEAICDQVAILKKGRVIGSGPLAQFLEKSEETVEVAVTKITEIELAAISELQDIRKIPEGFSARIVGVSNRASALRALGQMNAQILWITPVRQSLERFFVPEMDRKSGL